MVAAIAAGETLSGLHRPGRGAAFWHDGRATAELDDPALAQAFFAIWLDERTREPANPDAKPKVFAALQADVATAVDFAAARY